MNAISTGLFALTHTYTAGARYRMENGHKGAIFLDVQLVLHLSSRSGNQFYRTHNAAEIAFTLIGYDLFYSIINGWSFKFELAIWHTSHTNSREVLVLFPDLDIFLPVYAS
jgi:membrane-bound acyltransferase YfiQ involved in biofilm formation